MTYWESEGLEDQALCGSDVKVVDWLSYAAVYFT